MNLTVTSVIVTVFALLLIRFATRILLKLLGWLLIIALGVYLMFYFGIKPFEKNPASIYTLEEKYCRDNIHVNKCDCIVGLIKADMEKRWSPEELQNLRTQRTTMAYMVKKSFDKVKPEIIICLEERKALEELKEFGRDMVPMNNDLMQEIGALKEGISEKSQNLLDSLVLKKENVDKRYDP